MVTEGLNKIAVALGKSVRDKMEKEIVELDVAVSVCQAENDALEAQAQEKGVEGRKLWKERKDKLEWLGQLDQDLRELSRPREGFPYLDDVGYETRVHELRVKVQQASLQMDTED